MARVLGLKQLLSKKYNFLEGLPDEITHCFGRLVNNFIMIIWGNSGNGKSSFLMSFIKVLMPFGKILYVALEEGFEATTQMNALRSLNEDEHSGKIEFADCDMNYDELVKKLKKKKSPRFIIIDSVQYWDITYKKYKDLKQMFKNKTFIFISHATNKEPRGTVADSIRYDAGIKARVEGFMVDVKSRYGGNNPYVIWEEGAEKYWGKNYRTAISGAKETKKKKPKPTLKKTDEVLQQIHPAESLAEPRESFLGERQVDGDSERILSELVGNHAENVTEDL